VSDKFTVPAGSPVFAPAMPALKSLIAEVIENLLMLPVQIQEHTTGV
jgi:hypothetical protein